LVRPIIVWLYRAAGAGVAIVIMEMLARLAHQPLMRVPFVTSIVVTLALPDSAPARPYAVIAGHLLSTAAGFCALWVVGPGETASAVAVGLAAFVMLAARAMHPPAGTDAFLVAGMGLPLGWVLDSVLVGALLLVGFSWVWAAGERRWLAPARGATTPPASPRQESPNS
jgi:CBS-domain-containing membrane protein